MLERPVRARSGARSRLPVPPPVRTPDIVGTLPVAAVTAAVWAALVGLVSLGVLVVLAWAVSGRGEDGLSTPLQASGVVWLIAHHAPVLTPGGASITLLPLALVALPVALLYRAGRWAARITAVEARRDAVLIVVAGTATYAGIALGVAQASSIAGAQVPELLALGWAALVAAVGLTWGVASGAGFLDPVRAQVPARVRRVLLTATAAGAALATAAGLVAVLALVSRWSVVTGLERQVATGAFEALELFLVSLAYLPNLLLWALSYLAGPGFAAGGGATIDPFSVSGALLPGVPILGAVPADAPVLAPLLLLAPVLAGVLAALVLRRRHQLALLEELLTVVAAAIVVGVTVTLLGALSGGSLGQARLADLGPHAVLTGLAVAGLVAAGGALVVLVARAAPTVWVHDDTAG